MHQNNERIISIHQPNYIPWLGYFYKIYQSDVFVFLDDVQFSNQGMQNYHYIKTPQGSFRLKIPVVSTFGIQINQVTTKNELNWKQKHLKTLEMNYRKSPHFDEVYQDFKQIIEDENNNLSKLDQRLIAFICSKFEIKTSLLSSSMLEIQTNREEKVLDICQALNATVYYSGTGAKAYQNEEQFNERGIELRYSAFKPFAYPQLWGEFISNVSILDYLMNCGYDWDRVLQNQENP